MFKEKFIQWRNGCILTHGLIYTPFTVILSKFPSRSPQIHWNQGARELSSNAVPAHKNHTYSVTTSIRGGVHLNRKWMSQDSNPSTVIGIWIRALFTMICCCIWVWECYQGTTKEYKVPLATNMLWSWSVADWTFLRLSCKLSASYIWLLLFLSIYGHKEKDSRSVRFISVLLFHIDKWIFEPNLTNPKCGNGNFLWIMNPAYIMVSLFTKKNAAT